MGNPNVEQGTTPEGGARSTNTPEGQIQAITEALKVVHDGIPEPELESDFDPLNLRQGVKIDSSGHEYFDGQFSHSFEQQARPYYLQQGKIPAFDLPSQNFPPVVSQHLYNEELSDQYLSALDDLEADGLVPDYQGLNDVRFATHLDLLAMNTGVSTANREVWEANHALWEDRTAELEAFNQEVLKNRARLEKNQVYLSFVRDFEPLLGPEYMDAITASFARNNDEQGIGEVFSWAAIQIMEDPDMLKTDEGKARFAFSVISASGRSSQKYQIKTGQLEPDPPPGLWDVVKKSAGSALGVADLFLFEELIPGSGFNIKGGGVFEGPLTALGYLGGTPGTEQLFQGLGTLWAPIDEHVTKPFREGISHSFARGSFFGWEPWGMEMNPYRAYLTPGRNLALTLNMDPGTRAFDNFSGAIDLSTYIVADPVFVLAPAAKAWSAAARIPLEAGTAAARNALINKAIVPYFGKSILPTGWTGMKGPLTRAFYVRFAKTAEELSHTKRATALFTDILQHAQRGKIEDLTTKYRQLIDSPNLVNAFEQAESLEDVRQMWVSALTGENMGPRGEELLRARANHNEAAAAAATKQALENGTLGALDVDGVRYGQTKFDGLTGLVDNGDGTYAAKALNADGGNVLVWNAPATMARTDTLRKLRAAIGGERVPPGVRKLLDAAEKKVKGAQVSDIWASMHGNAQNRVLEWMAGHGIDYLQFGPTRIVTPRGRTKLTRAIDKVTDGKEAVLGGVDDAYRKADDALRRVGADPDELSWIISLPKPVKKLPDLIKFLPKTTRQGVRARQAKFTRQAENFPQGVSLHDTKLGVKQIGDIGRRLGLEPDEIGRLQREYRTSATSGRFEAVRSVRAQMVDSIRHWRMKHGIGGLYVDEGEGLYGKFPDGSSIARGESKTRVGVMVNLPFEPTQLAAEIPFFRPDFYTELDRLRRARFLSRLPFGSKIVEGFGFTKFGAAKKNRAKLVARWQNMIENRTGLDLSGFEQDDIYNMAYASVVRAGNETVDGMGIISRAAAATSRWHSLIHKQFSIQALSLRASSWMQKVALLEEPIRAAIAGIPSLFSNPVGAVRDIFDGHFVRVVQHNADLIPEIAIQARDTVRAAVYRRVDDVTPSALLDAAIDEMGDLGPLGKLKRGKQAMVEEDVIRALDEEVAQALTDADFTVGGRVTSFTDDVDRVVRAVDRVRNQRASRIFIDENGVNTMGLEDILNIGYADVAGDVAHSIYNRTIFDTFTDRVDTTRGYVAMGKSGVALNNWSLAKGSDLVREANDPYFRIAVKQMLDNQRKLRPENIRSILARSQWRKMRDTIKRVADSTDGINPLNDVELATWYFTEFMPDVVDSKLRGFWIDEATGEVDHALRTQVLQGVMDRQIKVGNVKIPLHAADEQATVNRLRDHVQAGYDEGKQWTYMDQSVVGNIAPARGWSPGANKPNWGVYDAVRGVQDFVNTPLHKVIEIAGARATQNITRQPGWRRVYGDYRAHYENLGWGADKADAAARMQATKTINTLMYNAQEMSNWRHTFNNIVPFGAAMVEVMEVWMKNLPRDNVGGGGLTGWAVGSVALQRKYQYAIQGLEALGLIRRDPETGQAIVSFDSEGTWASKGLNAVFGAPQRLVRTIASIADVDIEPYQRIEFLLGTPFQPINPDQNGLMSVSSFAIGVNPVQSWAANTMFANQFGQFRSEEFEGGSIADLAESMDIELQDFIPQFLAVPENRQALIDAGKDPRDFNDLANAEDEATLALLTKALDESVVLPKGTYFKPNSGAFYEFAHDYIFPYGAPASFSEAIGSFQPGAWQHMLRSLEMSIFTDEDGVGQAPIQDWFMGPVSAYRTNDAIIEGLMMGNIAHGTVDKFMELQNQASFIRGKALTEGLAYMEAGDGSADRFRWEEDVTPEEFEQQVEWQILLEGDDDTIGLSEQIANLEESAFMYATNYAIASGFSRGLTMFGLPISPQVYTESELEVQKFWGTKELGDQIFQGHGPEAYARWLALVGEGGIAKFAPVLRDFLTPQSWEPGDSPNEAWGLAPSSDVKRNFLAQPGNADLHLYLTPSKVYPTGYVPTETIEEFFQEVERGGVEFADPRVFLMRAYTSALSFEQGAERTTFFQKGGNDPVTYALEHWDEYMTMITTQMNARDYLDFVDAEVFDGVYNEARQTAKESVKKDAHEVVREQQQSQRKRNLKTIGQLINDIDGYGLDPEDAAEMRSALFGLQNIIQDLADVGASQDQFFSRSPEEKALDTWFDAILNPHSNNLTALYEIAGKADTKYERSLAYDNIRFYENTMFKTSPLIDGRPVPNPYAFRLSRLVSEAKENGVHGSRLESAAVRQLALKPSWLSRSDVEVLKAYVDLNGGDGRVLLEYMPDGDEEWADYNVFNSVSNRIEALRIEGAISDSEATKAKNALEEEFHTNLRTVNRGAEVDFQDLTPAMMLNEFGTLHSTLIAPTDWAQNFIAESQAMRDAGISGIDDLWRTEYWPAIRGYLDNNPVANQEFKRIGGIMFKESNDRLTIARRFFLGKFGKE